MRGYTASLGYWSRRAFRGYESITIDVGCDQEAIERASEWATKRTYGVDSKTWLQVTTSDGKDIYSHHLGRY